MPLFDYKARDKFGKLVNGIMEGDENAVFIKLKQMGCVPVSITKTKKKQRISNFLDRFKRIKFSDLNMFNWQFAALQKAGVPILLSLNALKEQTKNEVLKDVIGQIIKDIEGGTSLSSALKKHPRIFNRMYISMIESAEASGLLDEVLERLADSGEQEEKVRLRIKTATRYPIIVVTAIVIAFLVLIILVIPRFAKLYSQFTVALPLPTRILLGINYGVTKLWWLLLFVAGAFIFGFNKFVKTTKGKTYWHSLKLKFPVFGPLTLKLIMSRFTRITGTLLRSGISILQVLELASENTGNIVVSRTIDKMRTGVSEGKNLAGIMKTSTLFPPIVTQMVVVGEKTGKLSELLLHVSNYYDSRIDYTIDNLISLIEPILMFVLGCVILFMALGIFLPIWNLMDLFR